MANQWGIPKNVEDLVKQRDLNCVYCGVPFNQEHLSIKTKPSWEHIINDVRLNSPDNIALCCRSCNASKGTKKLQDWLFTPYCQNKNINKETVADVVKKHL